MSALRNSRHEAFARELAEGASATDAYAAAGYAGSVKSQTEAASRLSRNINVRSRIAELKARAAFRTELTVAGLTEDLLRVAKKGEHLGEAAGLSVARAALMDAAKLNGLIVERSENINTNHIVSDAPMTDEEWVATYGAEH